jgi:uncharacterized protein (DUF433 family)
MGVDPRKYRDPRDVPKYNLAEVALYLDIPESTVRWWCLGRKFRVRGELRDSPALIKPALIDPRNPSLSFYNLAEIHILAATRRFHKISIQKIRDAIDYIEAIHPSPHPLLSLELFTDGASLFIKRISETVNLSKKGQLAFKELVDAHLSRIIPDSSGLPEKLYPIRHQDTQRKPIIIVPNVCGGRPITPKKGIRISVLLNRRDAGETYQQIADDYGLAEAEVKEAIQYMEAA